MSETNKTELVIDFAINLSREMLKNGANLERVSITIQRLSKCYRLRDVSVTFMNSVLFLAAKDEMGLSFMRQQTVPSCGINMSRLKRLNVLVHKVGREKPAPEKLQDMLFETLMTPAYGTVEMLLGYNVAMICLCRLFGGVWQDMLIVILNTTMLYYLTMMLSREKLNRIISNVVSMFLCGCLAILFTKVGFAKHLSAIVITNAFYLIPGIQMVNAFRNIICGNEMNGIIEMVKVVLEVVTIVAGLYIACLIWGYVPTTFF